MPEETQPPVHFILQQKPGQIMYRADHVICGKEIVSGEAGIGKPGMRVTDIKTEVTCGLCKAKL